jgi:hypothetical protein
VPSYPLRTHPLSAPCWVWWLERRKRHRLRRPDPVPGYHSRSVFPPRPPPRRPIGRRSVRRPTAVGARRRPVVAWGVHGRGHAIRAAKGPRRGRMVGSVVPLPPTGYRRTAAAMFPCRRAHHAERAGRAPSPEPARRRPDPGARPERFPWFDPAARGDPTARSARQAHPWSASEPSHPVARGADLGFRRPIPRRAGASGG